MDCTSSVSKGVFLFPNSFKNVKKTKKKHRPTTLGNIFCKEHWYVAFKQNWDYIETQLEELHDRTYSELLNDMVVFLKSSHQDSEMDSLEGIIPSATLLTGVNQPDHVNQFKSLVSLIREEVTPYVAMVSSPDASSVKHLVENVVWQLINGENVLDYSEDSAEGVNHTSKSKMKKNQCTMKTLLKWYESKNITATPKKKKNVSKLESLVIIIPDFESFNCNILQDFVMIVSSYVAKLPITLVFGVATSVSALHKSFPYQVSSKLLIKVFHSHPSHVYMNQVLENVFLTHTSPFHLSGKAFELLTDVFLFYDFSVTGFIQSIKYCMMEHYYGDNIKALCCNRERIDAAVMSLSSEDLENIRQLLSFRPFLEVQHCQTKIALFEDDNFFREILKKELHKLHDYVYSFYLCVRLLVNFVSDLPRNIFGKTIREIYAKCAVEHITKTEGFKETMQLINFQSQVKLIESIQGAIKVVNNVLQVVSPIKPLRSTPLKNNQITLTPCVETGEEFARSVRVHLLMFLRQIENASNETSLTKNYEDEDMDVDHDQENISLKGNRFKLKEKLLKATRVDRIQSEYEMIRSRFLNYLEGMFAKGLNPPHTQTFHEILFFTEVSNVKKQIIGSPRGALHTALGNPAYYLQCTCCELWAADGVGAALPDVSLAYKLHRECGKHINLYDWLQAFAAVLSPDCDDENRAHDPIIQVRFTRAVAELQFLGFIKSSKRKTDHVMRLTW